MKIALTIIMLLFESSLITIPNLSEADKETLKYQILADRDLRAKTLREALYYAGLLSQKGFSGGQELQLYFSEWLHFTMQKIRMGSRKN